MPYHTKNCVLWHIPHTGGTSTLTALRRAELLIRHNPPFAHEFPGECELLPGKRVHIATVRHPLAWYRSHCAKLGSRTNRLQYHLDNENNPKLSRWYREVVPHSAAIKLKVSSLDGFVAQSLRERPGLLSDLYRQACSTSEHIAKTETLTDDLPRILEASGDDISKLKVERENVIGSAPTFTETFSQEVADAVMESEAEAVKQYQYDYIPEGLVA